MTLQKLPDTQQGEGDTKKQLGELQREANALISRIWLHLGNDVAHARDVTRMLTHWFFFFDEQFDHSVWAQRQADIFVIAQRIISEHKAKIGLKVA